MSEPNLKAMTQAELLKYLEDDFMPRLLPKLSNVQNLEAENARLKAEFDEYRKAATIAADSVIDERNHLKAELTNCKSEADYLKAEVERLRKAGDELAENFKVQTLPWTSRFNCYLAWNAAKEGKQP